MKTYVLIGLISILVVFGIVVSIRCSKLERENIKLRIENSAIIDSISLENKRLEKDIENFESQLIVCESQIDSLKKLKQRVIVEYKYKYVVSKNLTEGVEKLKENLKCERQYSY